MTGKQQDLQRTWDEWATGFLHRLWDNWGTGSAKNMEGMGNNRIFKGYGMNEKQDL